MSSADVEIVNLLQKLNGKMPKRQFSVHDYPLDLLATSVDITDQTAALVKALTQTLQPSIYVGTVSSATSTTLTDTGSNWETNQWANYLVDITGGTGVGQVRIISSNTSDTLTVNEAWTTIPDSTSTYAIRFVGVGTVSLGHPVDTNGYVEVDLMTPIPAGSNLIGSVNANLYGSNYGSPASSYEVKVDASGQLYIGNYPPFNFTSGTEYLQVAIAQSITLNAAQNGTWNVGVTSLPSIPAGSNLIGQIDAIQSGSWSVGVNNFPTSQTVAFTRTTITEDGTTGSTSATANTYTQLVTASTIVHSFTFLNTGTSAMYVGFDTAAARYVVPNGMATFTSDPTEQIDISDFYVVCPGAVSQTYTLNWEV